MSVDHWWTTLGVSRDCRDKNVLMEAYRKRVMEILSGSHMDLSALERAYEEAALACQSHCQKNPNQDDSS